jgi:hypothetical protein
LAERISKALVVTDLIEFKSLASIFDRTDITPIICHIDLVSISVGKWFKIPPSRYKVHH